MSLASKNSELGSKICAVYFVLMSNVISIEPFDEETDQIDFGGVLTWNRIFFTYGSAAFIEQLEFVNEINQYNQNLTFSVPGNDSSNLPDLKAIINTPVALKIVLTNGEKLLLGTLDNPCKLSVSKSIGDNTSSTMTMIRKSTRQIPRFIRI